MSVVTDKIRSRAYWDIAIRPQEFREGRLDYASLEEVLVGDAVRFRGWPVPFIDERVPVERGANWIGQEIDAQLVSHTEAWRFFTSGQFNQLRAVSADWRNRDRSNPHSWRLRLRD